VGSSFTTAPAWRPGRIPYEDFPDTYGVGVFVLTGLVLRAFDGSIGGGNG
jgi:hypothetical protein